MFIVEYLFSEHGWDKHRLVEQDCFSLYLEMNGNQSQALA